MFIPYPHLERVGKEDVEGILAGDCYIFPKIDGTNASLWLEDGNVYAGSRNRALTLEADNAGFMSWALEQSNIYSYLLAHEEHYLYGEWLVPHTFKDYREDSWRNFYVFDVGVCDYKDGSIQMLPYDTYKPLLDEYKIEYIPAVKIIKNPSEEELIHEMNNNFYLVETVNNPGEGIVIKNYGFRNKWGRQVWAKMVREEFKEKNLKEFGTPEGGTKKVEQDIVEAYVTKALCEKTFNKILNGEAVGGSKKIIPRVLETVWHELITEETYNFVKEFNNPSINFKMLKALCINATKKNLPQMF